MDHPNCIKLHAIWETDKRVFIVTELVSGGELLDRCVIISLPQSEQQFEQRFLRHLRACCRLTPLLRTLQGDGAGQLL